MDNNISISYGHLYQTHTNSPTPNIPKMWNLSVVGTHEIVKHTKKIHTIVLYIKHNGSTQIINVKINKTCHHDLLLL